MTSDRERTPTEQSGSDVFGSALRTSWWEIVAVILILASLPIYLFVDWLRGLVSNEK